MPLIFVENDAHIMETHPTGFKRRHCFVAEPETVRTIPCRCEEDQHQLFMNLLSPILQVRDEFTSIQLNEVDDDEEHHHRCRRVGGGGSWGTDTYASTTYVSLWIQKISF